MRASIGVSLIVLGCCLTPHAAGQVNRCTEGGKAELLEGCVRGPAPKALVGRSRLM
jgi:hypothetical protein